MVTIDQIIAEYLNEWTFTAGGKVWPIGNFVACIIALVLSTVLCSIIGIEREKRGRTAGLRTPSCWCWLNITYDCIHLWIPKNL